MAARGWMMEIHLAGWGLIALIAWKTVIAARSLRRGFDRRISRSVIIGVSLMLATLTLLALLFSLMWTWRAVALPDDHRLALDSGAGSAGTTGHLRLAMVAPPENRRLYIAPELLRWPGGGSLRRLRRRA